MKRVQKPRPVKISPFVPFKDQMCQTGNNHWSVPGLAKAAETLPVFNAPLSAIHLSRVYDCLTMWELVGHMKSVMAADLSYPIIFGQDGRLMDGAHRVMKALLLGKPTIRAVRFENDPPPDRTDPEE